MFGSAAVTGDLFEIALASMRVVVERVPSMESSCRFSRRCVLALVDVNTKVFSAHCVVAMLRPRAGSGIVGSHSHTVTTVRDATSQPSLEPARGFGHGIEVEIVYCHHVDALNRGGGVRNNCRLRDRIWMRDVKQHAGSVLQSQPYLVRGGRGHGGEP